MFEATAQAPPPAQRTWKFSAWCIVAAFGAYFCMYAFRKPFTAATYEGLTLAGWELKFLLNASQVLGYTLSKFIGIKVIAEMRPERRAAGILVLIGIAEAALLLFAVAPVPLQCLCLFLNGLPLGMVFGLVLGFLEGRQVTEALAAGLCASFIVASGVVKSVGVLLLENGVAESWMPVLCGLIFTPPLLVFVWMLGRIPAPSPADVAQRGERAPMTRHDRSRLFWTYAGGLTCLVIVYVLITILRGIRDDFAVEIWRELGQERQASVFAQIEVLVMLGVVVINGSAVVIASNHRAFHFALAISLGGLGLACVALVGQAQGWLSAFPFMVLLGMGLYIPYVAIHTTVFERLIAIIRDRSNLGYLMYLADAFGYLGLVAVMLVRGSGQGTTEFLGFFLTMSWVVAVLAALFLALTWWYFARPVGASASAAKAIQTASASEP